MSNINIGFKTIQNEIETHPDCIDIEITGLKTLNKFIALEDTPLYYDNGKFFKVENNRIVYTDIQWENITGDITANQELQDEILKLVEENAKQFTEEAVTNAIEIHDNDKNAHPFIQELVQNNFETLDNKIELNKIDTEQQISEVNKKVEQNKTEITKVDEYTKKLNQKIEDLTLEVDVDIKESISKLESDLEQTNTTVNNNFNTVNNNFNTLNNKIDTVKNDLNEDIKDLTTTVNNNYENLISKIQTNTDSINDLTQEVNSKFEQTNTSIGDLDTKIDNAVNSLNSDLDSLEGRVSTNETNISNNTQLINQTIENLKLYSKTSEFADVAFTGEYSDLLNIPENIATNEYVQEQIQNAMSSIVEFSFKVVDVLPPTGESNFIYLVPQEQSENNVYSEYIWIKETSKFELIGSTETDLSGYYTSIQIDNLLSKKVDKEDGKSLVSDTEIERLATLKNYDDTEIKSSISNLQNTKQDKLTAGEGINIQDNVISNTLTIVFRDWSV